MLTTQLKKWLASRLSTLDLIAAYFLFLRSLMLDTFQLETYR